MHECAPRFNKQILTRHLHGYTLHEVHEPSSKGGDQQKPLHLSQHCFGWPEHRPRAYSVLARDATVRLDAPALDVMELLFRKPVLPVSALWCASQADLQDQT